MGRYSKESALTHEEIVEKAAAYFGPAKLGLEIAEQKECCLLLQGGGGHVYLEVEKRESGSIVEIETREWDYQVKEFLKKV